MPVAKNVNINVEGNFSGNIIIGDNNIVYGNQNGAIVNKVKQKITFESRSRPINLRPRAFPSLLSRTTEIANIKSAITNSMPITLFGENGIGKTSLLRYVSHLTETKKFNDGVIYLIANGEERDDLLQQIFDSFYTSNQNQKPTDAQLREDLKNIQALIILDDLTLKREDTAFLLDALPNSTFIFASTERILWGEGHPIGLDGLPENDALQLFERELGRNLKDDEKESAAQVCKILLYHPLRILQTASMIREDGLSIPQAFAMLTKTRTQSPVLEATLNKTNETQKKILSLLAVAGGFALTREHLQKLAGSLNFDVDMNPLLVQGFVSADGASFSLSGEAVVSLVRMWDLSGWEDALIGHLSNWLQTAPQDMLIDQMASTLFYLIQRAGEKKQWSHIVTIGRRLEQIYALKKKWDGWLKILNLLRMAAVALRDKYLEGFVSHQLGSRAMCLDLTSEAQELLNQAFKIRKAIGDKAGMQITQHNLNVLLNVPITKASQIRSTNLKPTNVALKILLVGGIGGAFLLLFITGIFLLPLVFNSTSGTPIPRPTDTLIPQTATKKATATLIPPTTRPTRTATPRPVLLYDFILSAPDAIWEQGYDNDGNYESQQIEFFTDAYPYNKELYVGEYEIAYAGWETNAFIEDTTTVKRAIAVFPYSGIYSFGKVLGHYDLNFVTIQRGDFIRTRAGFAGDLPYEVFDPPKDGVLFQIIFYETTIDKGVVVGEWLEYDDGQTYSVDLSLDNLSGKSGYIALVVDSISNTTADFAIWISVQLWGSPR